MAICPNGHDSASDDFCDICGMRIAGTTGYTRPIMEVLEPLAAAAGFGTPFGAGF